MIALEKYGGGASPALEQTVAESIHTDFVDADLAMHALEKDVLRKLAEQVAILAALPAMKEKRELWRRHNRLEMTRPVIFCDPENGWNEIITERQLQCKTKIARRWEMNLRKEIFWGEEMGDDRPVEAIFNVPYTCSADDWGIEVKYHMPEQTGSYVWESPIKDYARDLPRLHPVTFEIDWNVSKGCLDLASEIFGGILDVRQKGTWWWSLGITYPAILLRGMEKMFTDFRDYPDEVKQLFSIIRRDTCASWIISRQTIFYRSTTMEPTWVRAATVIPTSCRNRISAAGFAAPTCGDSPRARSQSAFPQKCMRNLFTPTRSRSWPGSV